MAGGFSDVSRLPIILAEFEEDARRLANSVQHMMENLSSQLHNVRQRIFDRVIKMERAYL